MDDETELMLDRRELLQEIPDWLPGRYDAINQLKLFVRWVCRIHHNVFEVKLAIHIGLGRTSPFKSGLEGVRLRSACFELAVFLGRSLGIKELHTQDLTNRLMELNYMPVLEDEYGTWHGIATGLRDEWLALQKEGELA